MASLTARQSAACSLSELAAVQDRLVAVADTLAYAVHAARERPKAVRA